MQIEKITSNNNLKNTRPNFQAFPIAKINSKLKSGNDVFLYEIEKSNDKAFMDILGENLMHSNDNRFRVAKSNMHLFLKRAFESVNSGYMTLLGIKNDKPFGMMMTNKNNKHQVTNLKYFLTWNPKEENRVKDGGTMFMRHLFEHSQHSKRIDLVPAFGSDAFYQKFGFEFFDEYLPYEMSLDNKAIINNICVLNKKLDYTPLEPDCRINLFDIAKPE